MLLKEAEEIHILIQQFQFNLRPVGQTVDQLFERGVQYSLQLQADAMKESMAQERTRTARTARLPELQIGLKGGFVGQPVVWELKRFIY